MACDTHSLNSQSEVCWLPLASFTTTTFLLTNAPGWCCFCGPTLPVSRCVCVVIALWDRRHWGDPPRWRCASPTNSLLAPYEDSPSLTLCGSLAAVLLLLLLQILLLSVPPHAWQLLRLEIYFERFHRFGNNIESNWHCNLCCSYHSSSSSSSSSDSVC